MKIVFLDHSTLGNVPNIGLIKQYGDLEIYDITLPQDAPNRTQNADIIITNKVKIDRQIMDHARNLKLICIAATGTNNVDLDYARLKKIEVKNVSGYSTMSVTQATFSMLFYLLNHSGYFDAYVKSGNYSQSQIFTHHGREFYELKGKVFGIIGMGTIGNSVAGVAAAFGCRVIYHSTSGKNLDQKPYKHYPLNELLAKSDIVSIHAPLNNLTENLINKEALKLMKPSAILINTGRGGIVNEGDLAEAMNENVIAGAALDVLTNEPILKSNPLLSVKDSSKIYITPHIAWASMEARTLLIEKLANNIKDFVAKNK